MLVILRAATVLLALPLLAEGVFAQSPPREEGMRVLHPVLLDRARRNPEAKVLAWVFFTDKGFANGADVEEGLVRFRSGLGAKARSRREALGPGLGVDFRDLPVPAAYVERLSRSGCRVRRVSRWLNAVSVDAPAGRLAALAELPFVLRVEPLRVKRASREASPEGDFSRGLDERLEGRGEVAPQGTAACVVPVLDPVEAAFYGPSYNQLGEIQVLDLHRLGYTGAGVRVMVLDTGFQKTHPAFAGANWIAEWDFVNEDGETGPQIGDAPNQHYHGTGVWATAGGFAPGALIGPAFAAEFVLAKTEDVVNEVRAEEDNYVAALEWADTLGVDVATASLAYFTFDDSTGYTVQDLDGDTAVITRAVDVAVAKGMVCVNAAGNEGPADTTIWTPADADSVIAVGAVDSCATVAGFSSRGPTADGRVKPDISARGRNTYWARAWTNGYGPANGTSLATPLIGGLAALLREAHPGWDGARVREAILATGTLAGTPDNAIGHGIAQGLAALTHGGGAPAAPRMTMPFRLLSPLGGAVITDLRPTLVWGASDPTHPGEIPLYRVLVDDAAGFASPDTVYVGPDTTYTFVLGPPVGTPTWWRVEAVGDLGFVRRALNDGAFTVSTALATEAVEPVAPRVWLGPAVPNPFRSGTALSFELAEASRVRLVIVDLAGREVRVVAQEAVLPAGRHSLSWDGRSRTGERVGAGVYVARLSVGGRVLARPLILLR